MFLIGSRNRLRELVGLTFAPLGPPFGAPKHPKGAPKGPRGIPGYPGRCQNGAQTARNEVLDATRGTIAPHWLPQTPPEHQKVTKIIPKLYQNDAPETTRVTKIIPKRSLASSQQPACQQPARQPASLQATKPAISRCGAGGRGRSP